MTESKGPEDEDKEKKYRVHWGSVETESPRRVGLLSKEEAEAVAKAMNQKYPSIRHEVVPVDDNDNSSED